MVWVSLSCIFFKSLWVVTIVRFFRCILCVFTSTETLALLSQISVVKTEGEWFVCPLCWPGVFFLQSAVISEKCGEDTEQSLCWCAATFIHWTLTLNGRIAFCSKSKRYFMAQLWLWTLDLWGQIAQSRWEPWKLMLLIFTLINIGKNIITRHV